MSTFTIGVITVLVIFIFIYQMLQRFLLHALNRALKKKDYDLVCSISDMGASRRLLSAYVCDLYRVKAAYLMSDPAVFLKEIDHMLENEAYQKADRKQFLNLYFHYFLNEGNKEYADKFMTAIEKLADEKFIKYNRQAYEVMIMHRDDLLEDMEKNLEADKYYGFPLGVVVYMIGMQYLYRNDIENARMWFYNTFTCFQKSDIYYHKAHAYVEELTKRLEDEKAAAAS